MVVKASLRGVAGLSALMILYFSIVTLVSGWSQALDQFARFWYFIVGLAAGFGIQVGLYSYLRSAARRAASGNVVAVSGTTSTVAMVSCCSHYLVNILPIIGVSGAAAVIGQYQIELFWFGLIVNMAAILYIGRRTLDFLKNEKLSDTID